ncbi:MAG: hypothetical protein OIF47_13640 [Marinibacterium sp.]|nr:hypothetical protein [Marinibacterium sp.]
MTDRPAIVVALVLLGLIAADAVLQGGSAGLFVARKGSALIHWLAFWR